MEHRFPVEYINTYLIDHCNNWLGTNFVKAQQSGLYYYSEGQSSVYMRENPAFYKLLKQMSLFFGNENEKVNTVIPTPEMFRLLVKCAEMTARGELDFGHLLPRGLYNRLAGEFQRISGVEIEKFMDE